MMRATDSDNWNEHWERFGEAAELNPAHDYRTALIFAALPHAGPARIVDLGCGQGVFLQTVRARVPNVELVGIDGSAMGLERAKQRVPEARCFTVNLDAVDREAGRVPTELQGWASHVVCSEVLEHLDHPEHGLAVARTLLAPSGKLIVTVPGGPRSAFDIHIGHRQHFSPRALRRLAESAGLVPEAVYGAGFPFFNVYRGAVIARGRRLIAEAGDRAAPLPQTARIAMRVFGVLFRLNRTRSHFGWQTFGVFRRGDTAGGAQRY